MLIDLQFHSTYSDGYLSPSDLVKLMSRLGVKVAALTDHNTVAGLDEFRNACQKYKIKAITGLELYVTLGHRRMNILWYNFDDTNPKLHNILRQSQKSRRHNFRNILEKLVNLGFRIDINKILDSYTHYIPVNHIVGKIATDPKNLKKIKKELKINNPREGHIIDEYFKNKEIGILRESYINIERIFKLRKEIGGQIILNHPAKNGGINLQVWKKLKELGLDGVEVLSPHHSLGAIMYIQYLAREMDLIETGGSDFHRFEGGKYPIQSCFDYFQIDSKYLRGIKKIIE